MRPFVPFLLAACAAGCLVEPGVEPGAGGLVDAMADLDHPAVGVVRIGPAQCTGTLIAPRVIVTVKHCLPTGPTPAIRFSVGAQGEVEAGTGVAVFHRTPPEGYRRQRDDIVAIVLDRDAPVSPLSPRRAPMDGRLEGRIATLVGYGVTAAGATDDGTRRSGPATIDSVDRKEFETRRIDGQSTSCNGDSGGAVVLDGELAGVIIGSVWGNCNRVAIHTRVDQYPDVVDAAIAEATRRAAEEAPAPLPEPEPSPPEDPPACDCDWTWGCDECWCEPEEECAE